MSGSTPGWRRRYWYASRSSCSGGTLPRRWAESAARKSFCPTSGASIPSDNELCYDDDDDLDDCEVEIKNEDDARPVEPGWPPDSLRHANHTVLTSITSSPSNPTSGASIPRDYSCAATTTTSAIARGHDKSLSPSNDLQRHYHCSFDVKHQLHQKPYSNLLQEVIFHRKLDVIARSKTTAGIGGLPKDAECSGHQRVPSMREGAKY